MVPEGLHVEGQWPEPVVVRRSWAKAGARPWNDDLPNPMLRLERGGHGFLGEVAGYLTEISGSNVFSPALFESATHIWRRAGFRPRVLLDLMEATLTGVTARTTAFITTTATPDIDVVHALDADCFTGFWRMSTIGLGEAIEATPRSVVLMARVDEEMVGYAIVGIQGSIAFLQRIAVAPRVRRGGIGKDLVHRSQIWAWERGARTMVLNVRGDNEAAAGLYRSTGFTTPGPKLTVLEYGHRRPAVLD